MRWVTMDKKKLEKGGGVPGKKGGGVLGFLNHKKRIVRPVAGFLIRVPFVS